MFRWILFCFLSGFSVATYAGYGSTEFVNPGKISVDLNKLPPGLLLTVDWNGHGVMIYRRSKNEIQHLRNNAQDLADPYSNNLNLSLQNAARIWGNSFSSIAKPFNEHVSLNPLRSIRPEIVVLSIVSDYSGCAVSFEPQASKNMGKGWPGGFHDPCRNVRFDLSGRVVKGHQYPQNFNLLAIPHYFDPAGKLVIGLHGEIPPQSDFRPAVDYNSLMPSQRLVMAAELGELNEVKAAVKAGARINAHDSRGVTALFTAISEGSYEVSKWLLEMGADPNLKNSSWGTPACLAVIAGGASLIRLLGRYGANWDSGLKHDPNCEEPGIIWSITKTSSEDDAFERVRALIESGAKPDATHNGKSALDYARSAKYRRVEAYLTEALSRKVKRP
jgi:ubiquinol-cytochrome c reductase iron-sulfur subunit